VNVGGLRVLGKRVEVGEGMGWYKRMEKAQLGKRQNENLSQTHTKKAKPVAFNLCAMC